VVYFSDQELEPARFAKISKKFKEITTPEQLIALGLPILNQMIDPATNTTIYEFDLSN